MYTRRIMFAVGCSALAFACGEQSYESRLNESQETIDNVMQADFRADDTLATEHVVVVGGDADVSPTVQRDLNVDGRADVCGRGIGGLNCAVSTGATFGAATIWQPSFGDAGGWAAGAQYYSAVQFPDVNGDGRADVCGRGIGGIYCALNMGATFGAATIWQPSFSDAAGWAGNAKYYSTIQFPDVNGDGRADVCGRGIDGIVCAVSTGPIFGPLTTWLPGFSDAAGWGGGPQYYSTIQFPDVNGDGRADVCGRGIGGINCAVSTGTTFGPLTIWQPSFGDAGGWAAGAQYYSTIQFPDVNGDGRADVCGRGIGGINCALNMGATFGAATIWQRSFSDAAGWAGNAKYYSTIQFPDVNGDGRADVCGRAIDGIVCAVSAGTTFGPPTTWLPGFSDAAGWGGGPQYYSTIQFPDVNRDGRKDVCGRGIGGINCAVST